MKDFGDFIIIDSKDDLQVNPESVNSKKVEFLMLADAFVAGGIYYKFGFTIHHQAIQYYALVDWENKRVVRVCPPARVDLLYQMVDKQKLYLKHKAIVDTGLKQLTEHTRAAQPNLNLFIDVAKMLTDPGKKGIDKLKNIKTVAYRYYPHYGWQFESIQDPFLL